MKEELIFCKVEKVRVDKLEFCPDHECDTCPRADSTVLKKKYSEDIQLQKESTGKDEDERNFTIFTRHPQKQEYSEEELPSIEDLNSIPAHFTEMQLDILGEAYIPLVCKKSEFNENKNPVLAIEAFLLAHENGFYPPLWSLNYMYKIFNAFWTSNGKESLDKLFGFTPGKGQTPPFKALFNQDRDQVLMLDVFKLNLLGYSIDKASYMVSRRLAETKEWDKTGLNIKELSQSTIKDMYLKKWKKVLDHERGRKPVLDWLKRKKKSFLNNFPKDCFDSVK